VGRPPPPRRLTGTCCRLGRRRLRSGGLVVGSHAGLLAVISRAGSPPSSIIGGGQRVDHGLVGVWPMAKRPHDGSRRRSRGALAERRSGRSGGECNAAVDWRGSGLEGREPCRRPAHSSPTTGGRHLDGPRRTVAVTCFSGDGGFLGLIRVQLPRPGPRRCDDEQRELRVGREHRSTPVRVDDEMAVGLVHAGGCRSWCRGSE